MPHWRRRLDLAELAIKIAQTKAGTAPRDCLREASELMLAASDEIELMEHGRAEVAQEKAETDMREMVKNWPSTADDSDEHGDFWKVLGLNDPAPWDLFVWEGNEKPQNYRFPDGVDWEPYQRKESLRKLIEKVLESKRFTLKDGEGVDGFLRAAQDGRADMRDLYRLARARAEQPWDKRRASPRPLSNSPDQNLPVAGTE